MDQQIAERYPDAARREGFLARRRIARAILADALGRPPGAIEIGANEAGASVLLSPSGQFHLSFSARGEGALIGIGHRPIGVDLEIIRPDLRIPWNMLREDERRALRQLPDGEQATAFCRLWSAKEAIVKALGCGFRLPPETIRLEGWTRDAALSIADIEMPRGLFIAENGHSSSQMDLKLQSNLIEPEWTGGLVVAAACIA